VFLHGLWRSGSTYVWSQFRAQEGVCAFYEPLNTELARMTPARMAARTPPAHLRHPDLGRSYFAEFKPLLRRRGVAGYRRGFAYRRQFLSPDEDHPALESYLRGLTDVARARGKRAVLGFTGGFGRIGWCARRLGGTHIHIDRSPEAVCGSYLDQAAQGNPWFIARWLEIVAANRGHPALRPLAEVLPLPAAPWALIAGKRFYRRAAAQMSAAEVHRLTVYMWTLAAFEGLTHCSAVVDHEQLAQPAYCSLARARIQEETGLTVAFDGARVEAPRVPPLDPAERRAVDSWVSAALRDTGWKPPFRTARLAELSDEKADRLAALL